MPIRGIAVLWLPPLLGKNIATLILCFNQLKYCSQTSSLPRRSTLGRFALEFSPSDDDAHMPKLPRRFPSATSYPAQVPPEFLRQCCHQLFRPLSHQSLVEALVPVPALWEPMVSISCQHALPGRIGQ